MSREGYKMTELGDIPQDWKIEKLGDIFKLSSGSFLSQKDIIPGEYPVYGGNGINGYHNKYMFDLPQLIIGRVGAKCGCVCMSENKSWITDNALYISDKKKEYNEIYLFYLLENANLNQYANHNAQPVISGQKIYELNYAFPPLGEQQKIADILSTVDQQIEQTDALIEKTKELKKGLMQRLLTKGIGHTEFRDTEIGRIPKGWEVKRLGEVSDINPESLSSKTDPNFVLKYIDIESVTTGKINGTKEFFFIEAPSRARRIVVYNDVIISTVRPYLKAFAIVKSDEDNMICSTGFAVIRAINNNNPDFLFQYTLSDCFINQMSNKMVGSNYPAVNASDVKESLIAVPPINEQKRIAQVLSEFDIQINELEDKKEKLRILKSGLMDKLLTGRVRVKI